MKIVLRILKNKPVFMEIISELEPIFEDQKTMGGEGI